MADRHQPVWKKMLLRIGHVQAQVILFLLFWAFLTPYAILLKIFRYRAMPAAKWHKVENRLDLNDLRRTF